MISRHTTRKYHTLFPIGIIGALVTVVSHFVAVVAGYVVVGTSIPSRHSCKCNAIRSAFNNWDTMLTAALHNVVCLREVLRVVIITIQGRVAQFTEVRLVLLVGSTDKSGGQESVQCCHSVFVSGIPGSVIVGRIILHHGIISDVDTNFIHHGKLVLESFIVVLQALIPALGHTVEGLFHIKECIGRETVLFKVVADRLYKLEQLDTILLDIGPSIGRLEAIFKGFSTLPKDDTV